MRNTKNICYLWASPHQKANQMLVYINSLGPVAPARVLLAAINGKDASAKKAARAELRFAYPMMYRCLAR